MNRIAIRAALLTLGLGLAIPAPARPAIVDEDLPTTIVGYADLNLSSAAGRAALELRVRRAARAVCFDTGVRTAHQSREQQACLDFALEQGRDQADRAIAGYAADQFAARTNVTYGGR